MLENSTQTILMIRPVGFRKNTQTAVNNYFQKEGPHGDINVMAQEEFDRFVTRLREHGVNVIVVEDTQQPDTPDSIFPNNWISFHKNGTVGLYPMFAPNRRAERREDILETLETKGFVISDIVDYTEAEEEGLFLEGTGSMVLDRVHRKAYCALSDRAHEDLFIEFCEDFEYDPILFTANQTVGEQRLPIYHTNVLMCVAETFAVICVESIDDNKERKAVLKQLKESGKEVIAITEAQMHHFAGNMLQLKGMGDRRYLVMSTAAYRSLRPDQIKTLEKHNPIIHSPLDTIETCGGGSARCMMAEVFLPKG